MFLRVLILSVLAHSHLVAADQVILQRLRERKLALEPLTAETGRRFPSYNENSTVMKLLTEATASMQDNASLRCTNATEAWMKALRGGETWALQSNFESVIHSP